MSVTVVAAPGHLRPEELDLVRWLPIDRVLVGVVAQYLKVGIQGDGI